MSIAGYLTKSTRHTRLQAEGFRGIGPVLEGRMTLESRLRELTGMANYRRDEPTDGAHLREMRGPDRFRSRP
jgi:hypothetical protein